MKALSNDTTLFRLTVISPLVNANLARGELKKSLEALSQKTYCKPNGEEVQVNVKTLESWYYAYRRRHLEGLTPKIRMDKGGSKVLTSEMVEAIVNAKKENPNRSSRRIHELLKLKGILPEKVSCISVYRCLKAHDLSKIVPENQVKRELRAYEAEYAGALWYADCMHGPKIKHQGKYRKVYLISIIDDATRFICYSAFFFDETALSVEKALKQAVLKNGLCHKFVVDNGSGFKTKTLKDICALLGIHLIHCRPYHACGKAKIERIHRTIRAQLLNEINWEQITSLYELNQYLWAWISESYHKNPHEGLPNKMSPREKWMDELVHVRSLGHLAKDIDEIFYHYHSRRTKKDGTISFQGVLYEVPYELASQQVKVVVDPHQDKVLYVLSKEGKKHFVSVLDKKANCRRKRAEVKSTSQEKFSKTGEKLGELLLKEYQNQFSTGE